MIREVSHVHKEASLQVSHMRKELSQLTKEVSLLKKRRKKRG